MDNIIEREIEFFNNWAMEHEIKVYWNDHCESSYFFSCEQGWDIYEYDFSMVKELEEYFEKIFANGLIDGDDLLAKTCSILAFKFKKMVLCAADLEESDLANEMGKVEVPDYIYAI